MAWMPGEIPQEFQWEQSLKTDKKNIWNQIQIKEVVNNGM